MAKYFASLKVVRDNGAIVVAEEIKISEKYYQKLKVLWNFIKSKQGGK